MEKRIDEAAGVEPAAGTGAGSTARIGAESTTGVDAGLTTEAGAGSTPATDGGSTTGAVDTGTANETAVRATSSCRWAPEPEGTFWPFFLARRRSSPSCSSSSSSFGSSMTRRGASDQTGNQVNRLSPAKEKKDKNESHKTHTRSGCRDIRNLLVVSTPVDVHQGRGSDGFENSIKK